MEMLVKSWEEDVRLISNKYIFSFMSLKDNWGYNFDRKSIAYVCFIRKDYW